MFKKIYAKFNSTLQTLLANTDTSELLKGAFIIFVLKIGGLFFSFVFYFILGRIYGAEITGIFAISLAVANILLLFGLLGTDTATVRFVAQDAVDKSYGKIASFYKKVLSLILPLSFLAALLLFAYSAALANNVFGKPMLLVPFRIISFTIPMHVFTVINTASLRGLKKIRDSSFFRSIYSPFGKMAALILLTLIFSHSYLVPFYAELATCLTACIFSFLLWSNHLKRLRGPVSKNAYSMKEILKVSLPMFITTTMILLMGWTDIIMLGIFRTSAEAGIYRVALRMAFFVSFSLGALNGIASPKFAELHHKKEPARLKRLVKTSSKISFWVAFPVSVIFFIFAKQIMEMFGQEFSTGAATFIILSINHLAIVFFGPISTLLNMTGHQVAVKNFMLAGTAFNIAFNFILIPPFGIVGAGIATMTSTLLWRASTSFYAYKRFGYWVGYSPKFKII